MHNYKCFKIKQNNLQLKVSDKQQIIIFKNSVFHFILFYLHIDSYLLIYFFKYARIFLNNILNSFFLITYIYFCRIINISKCFIALIITNQY